MSKVTKKEDYVTFLEGKFSESTAKAMSLKVQLKTANLKVQLIKAKAIVVKKNAAAVELVARAAKAEVARAIKDYKKSVNFKDEVGEVACDAFEKGFEKCKRRVSKVFNLLD